MAKAILRGDFSFMGRRRRTGGYREIAGGTGEAGTRSPLPGEVWPETAALSVGEGDSMAAETGLPAVSGGSSMTRGARSGARRLPSRKKTARKA